MEESHEERADISPAQLEKQNEDSVRKLEQAKANYDKEDKRMKVFPIVIKAIFCLSLASLFFCIYLLLTHQILDGYFVDKKELQESISNIINNGGSIDEVKHAYNTKNVEELLVVFSITDFKKNHYASDTPLSSILSDLLVNYYNRDSIVSDSTYVIRLRDMISTYETIHPFDGLEENQRYYLENIRLKLDSNYYFIQDDLVKLGDELDRKNLLVTKYLNKSETSFWISIAAIIISTVLSIWQIFQGNRSKKQMERFLAEHSKEDSQKTIQEELKS